MSDAADEAGDRAPGEMGEEPQGIWEGIRGYLIGLTLAGVLTAASFLAVHSHLIWGPAIPVALVAFAIAQMGVHLVFFLHITTGKDNVNNALALAFGTLIVFLVMAGSIWIMTHLNANMMPMDKLMKMQR